MDKTCEHMTCDEVNALIAERDALAERNRRLENELSANPSLMSLERAKEVLVRSIKLDGSLGRYKVLWKPGEKAYIDGHFTLEELEAMVVYIRGQNHGR